MTQTDTCSQQTLCVHAVKTFTVEIHSHNTDTQSCRPVFPNICCPVCVSLNHSAISGVPPNWCSISLPLSRCDYTPCICIFPPTPWGVFAFPLVHWSRQTMQKPMVTACLCPKSLPSPRNAMCVTFYCAEGPFQESHGGVMLLDSPSTIPPAQQVINLIVKWVVSGTHQINNSTWHSPVTHVKTGW